MVPRASLTARVGAVVTTGATFAPYLAFTVFAQIRHALGDPFEPETIQELRQMLG